MVKTFGKIKSQWGSKKHNKVFKPLYKVNAAAFLSFQRLVFRILKNLTLIRQLPRMPWRVWQNWFASVDERLALNDLYLSFKHLGFEPTVQLALAFPTWVLPQMTWDLTQVWYMWGCWPCLEFELGLNMKSTTSDLIYDKKFWDLTLSNGQNRDLSLILCLFVWFEKV